MVCLAFAAIGLCIIGVTITANIYNSDTPAARGFVGRSEVGIFANANTPARQCQNSVPRVCTTDSDGDRNCEDDWNSCVGIPLSEFVCPSLLDVILIPRPSLQLALIGFAVGIPLCVLLFVGAFKLHADFKWLLARLGILFLRLCKIAMMVMAIVGCARANRAFRALPSHACQVFPPGTVLAERQFNMSVEAASVPRSTRISTFAHTPWETWGCPRRPRPSAWSRALSLPH